MPGKKIVRKLSLDFTKDIYKDSAKRCILPGKILLQSVSCWPDDENLFYKSIGWFLFWSFLVVEIFHVAYVIKHFRDISDAVLTGTTVTALFEAIVRLYIILTKRSIINQILVKIWKQFWNVNVVINRSARKELKKKARTSTILTSIFLVSSIICSVKISGDAFFQDRGMVLKSVFPFDVTRPISYELVYIIHYCTVWCGLFVINAFDFFFVALVTICSIQFAILQDAFENILAAPSKGQRLVIFGEEHRDISDREMLFRCLEQHQLLIGVCNELEESFNISILIQFVVSISAICAASLILQVDSSQFLKMLMYAAAHLAQLFYYCYAGHGLAYESDKLSDAIYGCNWHLIYDRDFRKALILIIQRSQRVQYLTAAGIAKLDFASFIQVLRVSFSFYTLLNSLLAKNTDQN